MSDKNLHRGEWKSGTVTGVDCSEDGLVTSDMAKPHPKKGRRMAETPRRRPVCKLVLLGSVRQKRPDQQNQRGGGAKVAKKVPQAYQTPECGRAY